MPGILTSTEILGLQLHGAIPKDTSRLFKILMLIENLTSMISTLWSEIALERITSQILLLHLMKLSIKQLRITSP